VSFPCVAPLLPCLRSLFRFRVARPSRAGRGVPGCGARAAARKSGPCLGARRRRASRARRRPRRWRHRRGPLFCCSSESFAKAFRSPRAACRTSPPNSFAKYSCFRCADCSSSLPAHAHSTANYPRFCRADCRRRRTTTQTNRFRSPRAACPTSPPAHAHSFAKYSCFRRAGCRRSHAHSRRASARRHAGARRPASSGP
jgi:hypothetical protein